VNSYLEPFVVDSEMIGVAIGTGALVLVALVILNLIWRMVKP